MSLDERRKDSLDFGHSKLHFFEKLQEELSKIGYESSDEHNKFVELKSKNQEKLDFSDLKVEEMYDNSTNRKNLQFSIKYNHNKTLTKRINQYSIEEMDI